MWVTVTTCGGGQTSSAMPDEAAAGMEVMIVEVWFRNGALAFDELGYDEIYVNGEEHTSCLSNESGGRSIGKWKCLNGSCASYNSRWCGSNERRRRRCPRLSGVGRPLLCFRTILCREKAGEEVTHVPLCMSLDSILSSIIVELVKRNEMMDRNSLLLFYWASNGGRSKSSD